MTDAAGTQNAQPRFSVGSMSRLIFSGYSPILPCSAKVHAKNVVTTTGPSTAWLRNTLAANGRKLAASDAAAFVGK